MKTKPQPPLFVMSGSIFEFGRFCEDYGLLPRKQAIHFITPEQLNKHDQPKIVLYGNWKEGPAPHALLAYAKKRGAVEIPLSELKKPEPKNAEKKEEKGLRFDPEI